MSETTSSYEHPYFSASTSFKNGNKINYKRQNNHSLNTKYTNTIDLITNNACAHVVFFENLFCWYFFNCLIAYIFGEEFF